jgi:hypothetical protein
MLTSARLALKLHRFETLAAILAGLVAGVAALVVAYRLGTVHVPAGCFDTWLSTGPFNAGDCTKPVQAFAAINESEAGKVFAAMGVLPFLVGLLAGVPIVGRELEGRTAQTAWSLEGSRPRWLARQFLPIALPVLGAVAFAALAADALEATRQPWAHSAYADLTLRGGPVVARAFAALSVGVLAGALIGRTLPALIVAGLASLVLVAGMGTAKDAWVSAQPTVVLDNSGHGYAQIIGSAYIAPDGRQITVDAAEALVPIGELHPDAWLENHGYKAVDLGNTEAQALGWESYELTAFVGIGIAALVLAVVTVDRRRPV